MARPVHFAFLMLAVTCLLTAKALAQGETTSAIIGEVRDSTNAVVADASVTITSLETGLKRSARTDDAGRFNFPQLRPGTYSVRVEAQGFEPRQIDNVAIPVSAADEVVAAARRIDQSSRGELERIGQVAAGVGKILKCSCAQTGRGIRILSVQERCFRVDRNVFPDGLNPEREIHDLGTAEGRCYFASPLRLELGRGGFDGVSSWLELREREPARVVGLQASLQTVFFAHEGYGRIRNAGAGFVGHEPGNRAGGFALREQVQSAGGGEEKNGAKFRHD